jgi:hypothetical protein
MANFPKLKTGAVAQYPITRERRLESQFLRFVDGTQQRYRDSGGAKLRWAIRLDLLDEGELASVEEFLTEQQGSYALFTFTDPLDGHEYENCRMEGDEAVLISAGEMQGSTMLTVTQ